MKGGTGRGQTNNGNTQNDFSLMSRTGFNGRGVGGREGDTTFQLHEIHDQMSGGCFSRSVVCFFVTNKTTEACLSSV